MFRPSSGWNTASEENHLSDLNAGVQGRGRDLVYKYGVSGWDGVGTSVCPLGKFICWSVGPRAEIDRPVTCETCLKSDAANIWENKRIYLPTVSTTLFYVSSRNDYIILIYVIIEPTWNKSCVVSIYSSIVIYNTKGCLAKIYLRIIDDDWFCFHSLAQVPRIDHLVKKITSYSYVFRLVLSHPDVVKYCMKRKYENMYFSFLFIWSCPAWGWLNTSRNM